MTIIVSWLWYHEKLECGRKLGIQDTSSEVILFIYNIHLQLTQVGYNTRDNLSITVLFNFLNYQLILNTNLNKRDQLGLGG